MLATVVLLAESAPPFPWKQLTLGPFLMIVGGVASMAGLRLHKKAKKIKKKHADRRESTEIVGDIFLYVIGIPALIGGFGFLLEAF